ncbi:MAG: IPT/TIG domain-containing protein, partial [Candidatus Bathyarchaeia archaeon]
MISPHNFRRNRKGIGTIFGMVFFILIVMLVFSSLVIVLNQNTGLEQTTNQAKQLDLDRYTELETVSINNPETAVLNNVVYLSCTVSDNGTLPVQLDRLWIRDVSTGTVGNIALTPSVDLQPGSNSYFFKSLAVSGSSYSDQFIVWFITARGNTISDYPNINQFNGISLTGTFPGVASINSTYQTSSTPMTLSLTTTQANQLIYVVVSYDDGNTLYTPTSTPTTTPPMVWTLRDTSLTTATSPYSGDSILKAFYAIDPSVGLVTISIHSTADELSDYYCSALAFAISNVNTTSPFDGPPLGQAPQTSIGESTTMQDTITTHYSNDFIIGALGIDNLNPIITPGAGFAQVMPVQSSYGASGEDNAMPRSVWSEWAIMKTPVKNLSVNCTFASTENWATILDAVRLVVVPPPTPLTLSPTSGPIGQVVTVSGTGFAPNSRLNALFDSSIVPFSFTTDASGNIPSGATFTVPQGFTAGIHTVTILDSKFNYANATFTVVPSITITSPVSATGVAGSSVTVSGSGFGANSALTATFGGVGVTLSGTTSTNFTGSFAAATFTVPSQTAGSKTITFTDSATPTQNTASTAFTLNPTVSISSASGIVGTTITLSGSNFATSSSITVKYDGTTLTTSPATVKTSGSGAIPSGVTFTVPASTAGNHTVTVTDASSNIGSATFTVTPTITLSPTNGNVGTPILVSGTGFAFSSTITITYDGTVQTYPTSNSVGSFSASFAAPVSVSGAHTVQASDGTNNGSAAFTITQIIALSPSSGIVSSTVAVSGSGFKANSTVTITLGGSTIATIPTPVTTSTTGSFSASFIVPAGSVTGSIAGAKTIQGNDGTNSANATFTVIPSITLNPTSGITGTVVTVSGAGYAANSRMTIKYGSSTMTTSPTTVTTTAYGTFSCTFAVPASVAGLNTVTGTDSSSNTAAATFTVIPNITLSPTTGNVGSSVTVTATGMLGSHSVTATLGGTAVTLSTSTT